ncbi:hypothetical protein D6L13_03790 [Salmonella enterica subsp. enterica serovar Ordonez]|nr:hypothetical protein [Salmonella enterica subsp. enterica serovar Ordonez]
MENLIKKSQQISNRIIAALGGEYVRRFAFVSDEQLQRFEDSAYRLMKKYPDSVYGELWLNAEGELVARSFEVCKNDELGLVGYEESPMGDMEPVFSGVAF